MKIELIGAELVITDAGARTEAIRLLPHRRWNVERSAWHCAYVTEVYQALVAGKFPVGHIPPAAISGNRVEAATFKGKAAFAVFTLPDPKTTEALRALPDYRTWWPATNCWMVGVTEGNAKALRTLLPHLSWSRAATNQLASFHDAGTEWRLQRSRNEQQRPIAADPITFGFTTSPYAHQREAFSRMTDKTVFALFMEQGTGKTKVAIDDAYRLHQQGKIDAVLVVCPNSVKSNWDEEIRTHGAQGALADICIWRAATKKKTLAWLATLRPKDFGWLVVNVDAFSSKETVHLLQRFATKRRLVMIVDESTRIKTTGAARTKGVTLVGMAAAFRRILTGTPVTQGPLDLYAQFKFLSTRILGFSSYYTFRNRYAVMGGWNGKEVVGYTKLDELQELIKPWSYRVTKDECLDLPAKVYQQLHVELSPEQRRLYDSMRDTMVAAASDGQKMSTQHVIVQLMRLQQITGGFLSLEVTDDEGALVERVATKIEGSNPKLAALLELAQDTTGKLIVWARYRAEIALVSEMLLNHFGAASVVQFHGGVKEEDRTLARRAFQDPASPVRFFVGQTETGGIGLTLTQARTVVYFSNSFSLESRMQSEDRAHRIGQTEHVTYIDLVAEDTLDAQVLATLRGKKSLADVITGDAWKAWL